MKKHFQIPGDQIKQLIPSMGGCFASDRITVDGLPVGYMYREDPGDEPDSGWRFLAGDESSDYIEETDHIGIYEVNMICNYTTDIIPHLQSPPGVAFERDRQTGLLVAVPFSSGE